MNHPVHPTPEADGRRPRPRRWRSRARTPGEGLPVLPPETRETLEIDKLLAWVAESAASPVTAAALREAEALPTGELEAELARLREMEAWLEQRGGLSLLALAEAETPLAALLDRPAGMSGADLLAVAAFLDLSGELDRELTEHCARWPAVAAIAGELAGFDEEARRIRQVIGEDGEIRDSASPELGRLRKALVAEELRLRRELDRIERRWRESGALGDTGLGWRDGRPVLPVQAGQLGQVEGLVVDQSQSGRTLFVEPHASLEIRGRMARLDLERRQEEARLLRELGELLRRRAAELRAARRALRRFDSLLARLRWGRQLGARVPEGAPAEGGLRIVQGRHPLLARHLSVVPLDLDLIGPPQGDRILLISGPNAGGKTVAMKTVGLFAAMLRLGLPLPCEEGTRIPAFETVLCDIGDQQSIENDLSTYSSHLVRMKRILEAASCRGLFLVDELGNGTDPEEGSAVAMAFLERMAQSPGLTVVSTHLGQLKAFAHDRPGIQNASMSFDETRIEPTFRLVQGVPGSSWALEILQRLELPRVILDRARHYLGSEQKNLARLIANLQQRLAQAERDASAAHARRIELESLTARYEERLKDSRREAKQLKAQAVSEAARIVKDANRLVENTVREIRQAGAERDAVRQQRERLALREQELAEQARQTEAPAAPREVGEIRVGDLVRLAGLETPAKVSALERGGRRLRVEAGILKLSVDRERVLEVLPAESGRRAERRLAAVAVEGSDPGLRLDLRGRSGDEAGSELEAYLDDCLVSGLSFATILHGKGTGVLRGVVQEILRSHPRVLSFRDGQPEEGGDGVTILKLDV
jgi:DNA mismatch repair protein MutS2